MPFQCFVNDLTLEKLHDISIRCGLGLLLDLSNLFVIQYISTICVHTKNISFPTGIHDPLIRNGGPMPTEEIV